MKKINIFNRNTNSPSYRRMPVSGGFNRGGGIPLFSGMTAVIFALFIATPSFATPTELDKKTVASKAYVDTKQDKITTGNITFYDDPDGTEGDIYVPGLVAYDPQTSTLSGNKIGILDQETIAADEGSLPMYSMNAGGYGAEMDNYVPTVRAVAEGLQLVWSQIPYWTALTWNNTTHPNAINAYSTSFTGTTNNWPIANQTQLVNGTTFANALALKQNILPAKWTSATSSIQMGANGGQTIELNTDGNVKRRYITAGGNAPLTLRSGGDNVILYVNGTKTVEEFQTSNFNGTGVGATTNQNYIKGALVSLELLKDVYSALHTEITNATPTGTPGNVAMYDPTTGALGDGVATYSGATAQNPYNATNDAAKIATAAAVETKQTKRVCAGYEPGHENNPDYCWLWDFPD